MLIQLSHCCKCDVTGLFPTKILFFMCLKIGVTKTLSQSSPIIISRVVIDMQMTQNLIIKILWCNSTAYVNLK